MSAAPSNLAKAHRNALKAFKAAGLEAEVRQSRRHVRIYVDDCLVLTMSFGSKEEPRSEANVRRVIRRLLEDRLVLRNKRSVEH